MCIGIIGLASALTLRGRGHEVCLCEQGTIPCERASSTDLSKIIRRTNYDGAYLELVERAAEQWQASHHQLSGAIYDQTDKLDILRSFTQGGRPYQSWQLLGTRRKGIRLATAHTNRGRPPVAAAGTVVNSVDRSARSSPTP